MKFSILQRCQIPSHPTIRKHVPDHRVEVRMRFHEHDMADVSRQLGARPTTARRLVRSLAWSCREGCECSGPRPVRCAVLWWLRSHRKGRDQGMAEE